MHRSSAWTGLLIAAALLAGCPACGPTADDSASQHLHRLLPDSDEAQLQRQPISATYRGDYRYLDRHGDLSHAFVAAERAAAADDLCRLAAIDRGRLAPAERIAYDAFRWQREIALREHEPALAAVWLPLRLEHFFGWHMLFPDFSSGSGPAPCRDAADYDAGLERIDGFIAWLGRAEARVREGLARGVVQPRIVVERLIEQFDAFAGHDLDRSPFYGPIRKLPDSMPAAERERLSRAYAAALDERLAPAFRRLRDMLRAEVLPRARDRVGLDALPGGSAYYRHLVEKNTTTQMTPDEIHRLGLAEVARIGAEMESIREQVGFRGTPAQFFEHLRDNPRFKPASAQALGDGYRAIGERVAAALPMRGPRNGPQRRRSP